MDWELRQVDDVEAVMDDSGVHVIINRVEIPGFHKEYSGIRVLVRADLMGIDPIRRNERCATVEGMERPANKPIMSFQGSANAVRKALIRFLDERDLEIGHTFISKEHASYIGYELHRAESTPGFVQD